MNLFVWIRVPFGPPEFHGIVKEFLGMNKAWKYQNAFLAALVLGALMTVAGCESKGPAERAGASIDKGVQNAKDTINPPGPTEKAGRALDKAVNP